MYEPVTNQPINAFGTEGPNNLQGLEKLINTKELTIHLRRPKFIDCEYKLLGSTSGAPPKLCQGQPASGWMILSETLKSE